MVSRGGGRVYSRVNRNIHESPTGSARSGGSQNPGSNSADQSVDSCQRGRSSNVLDQIPDHPSKRKMVKLNDAGQFTDAAVIWAIPASLRTMFKGPWTTWKTVDQAGIDALWQHFTELYQ